MATTTNHGKNLCLSCFWWSKGKCVKPDYGWCKITRSY